MKIRILNLFIISSDDIKFAYFGGLFDWFVVVKDQEALICSGRFVLWASFFALNFRFYFLEIWIIKMLSFRSNDQL